MARLLVFVLILLATVSTAVMQRSKPLALDRYESRIDFRGVPSSAGNVAQRSRVQPRQTNQTTNSLLTCTLTFSLATSTAPDSGAISTCKAGISNSSIEVSYRSVAVDGRWTSLKIFNISDTCQSEMVTVGMAGVSQDGLRLRWLQRDHGGGLCNCWSIHDPVLSCMQGDSTSRKTLTLDGFCGASGTGETTLTCSAGDEAASFCLGHGSLHRGIMTPVIFTTGSETDGCDPAELAKPIGERMVDSACSNSSTYLTVSFLLHMYSYGDDCDSIDTTYEGVELSFRCSGANCSVNDWIPLKYYYDQRRPTFSAKDQSAERFGIASGMDIKNGTIVVRGYSTHSRGLHENDVNEFICGALVDQIVSSGADMQFRWLQTARVSNDDSPDIISVDNVTITVHAAGSSFVILSEDFEPPSDVHVPTRWALRGTTLGDCGSSDGGGETLLVMGRPTNISGLGDGFVTISRIAATPPLNYILPEDISPTSVQPLPSPSPSLVEGSATPTVLASPSPSPTPPSEMNYVEEIEDQLTQDIQNNSELAAIFQHINESRHELALLQLKNLTSLDKEDRIDPDETVYLLGLILRGLSGNISLDRETVEDFLAVADNLIIQSLTDNQAALTGSSLLELVRTLALRMGPDQPLNIFNSSSHIALKVEFPSMVGEVAIQLGGHHLLVPEELVVTCNCSGNQSVRVATTLYQDLSGFLPPSLVASNPASSEAVLISSVITTNLQCGGQTCAIDVAPLLIEFPVQSPGAYFCASWEFTESGSVLHDGQWSTDYCKVSQVSNVSVECLCQSSDGHFAVFGEDLDLEVLRREGDILESILADEELRAVHDRIIGSRADLALMLLMNLTSPGRREQKAAENTVFLLGRILEAFDSITSSDLEESFIMTADNILSGSLAGGLGDQSQDSLAGSSLLDILEEFALNFLSLDERNRTDINTAQIGVSAFAPGQLEGREDVEVVHRGGHGIHIPTDFFTPALRRSPPLMTSYFLRDFSRLLPGTLPGRENSRQMLESSIVSSSIRCGDSECEDPLDSDPVRIEFSVGEETMMEIENGANVTCVFWEFTSAGLVMTDGQWSVEGCRLSEVTDSTIQCLCDHLTHFAVLLSPAPPEFSDEEALSLEIIGIIGVTVSLIALVVTIATFIFMKSLWSMRNYIHINLCISLFVAQLMFVAGVEPRGTVSCQVVAVLLHYFFTVTFMWMLMEGVVLYVALVRVFVTHQIRYIIVFTAASYGLPLVYMCVTVPLGFALSSTHYGSDTACWLRHDTHFVWAFIAPVILIILANVAFFVMAITIMYRHQKKLDQSKFTITKHWLKVSISLLVVMGVTWIVGVLIFDDSIKFIAWIYTLLVAFQGCAIFVLFVLMSKQVREAYTKWWRVRVNESEFLSKYFGEKLTSSSKRSQGLSDKSNDALSSVSASKDMVSVGIEKGTDDLADDRPGLRVLQDLGLHSTAADTVVGEENGDITVVGEGNGDTTTETNGEIVS